MDQPKISSRLSTSSRLSSSISRRVNREARFGDYILGSTLGEGEFGKVKLGWKKNGSQVNQAAIKLIRKDTVPPKSQREIKVFREINALKILHHPNIVKLEQVIQNDKYIGIVLEYASGGELFDYILDNRSLKEHVAARLFSQLVSGVYYLHSKGIVHRDLKLENLLLDKNKNVIITDFGFANSFRNKGNQLMSTSCGSPCYAAPELVVSDSKYDGRKVDVWSCGVILYAMLAGYLPWDDDAENPNSDNITRLYKYITTTPLTFPEYMPATPRDVLRRVLVADPEKRLSLAAVRSHQWLAPYAAFLSVTPKEWDDVYTRNLEKQAQLSAAASGPSSAAAAAAASTSGMVRSHSTQVRAEPSTQTALPQRGHVRSSSAMPISAPIPAATPVVENHPGMAASAAAHSTRRMSAMPTMSTAPRSHQRTTSQVADTSSAGTSQTAKIPSPSKTRSRLPAPQGKPRPISFHPTSTSHALYQPDTDSNGAVSSSYALGTNSGFSLYTPRASQPRVELSHAAAKSGEISRPLSFVQSASAQRLVSMAPDTDHVVQATAQPAQLPMNPPPPPPPTQATVQRQQQPSPMHIDAVRSKTSDVAMKDSITLHQRRASGFSRLFSADTRRHSAVPVPVAGNVPVDRRRFSNVFGFSNSRERVYTVPEEDPRRTGLQVSQDVENRSRVPQTKEPSAAKKMVNFFRRRSTVAS
ncbi:Fatty acyl-CoA synthetase and RNA processing-associated kinase 1 [Wickerhamiella sorbophila]|uniref:non-specific serine/threonine protein kinase n=1 Tax=Wickerhamiella sorbophila TaxID=45607 RepID=A0A2T0FN03_9ASCO|nr:Fatty acyl-CoA synthetase and RNA processing-associated kinase 1 [Wickerhamiella sorbophila]PRT56383.1 Fatty acyl-CoA synthetase and RNA processing-associated kinase 1 [Wickerhamiella sorbophila]